MLTIAGATVVETGLALPRAFVFTSDGQMADARIEYQPHAVLSELMLAPTLRRLAACQREDRHVALEWDRHPSTPGPTAGGHSREDEQESEYVMTGKT